MPARSEPGFHLRLLIAMRSCGLETADDLAEAIRVSIPTARALMRTSAPVIDAVTIFNIEAATSFSGRWLVSGGPHSPARPIAATPDEKRLLEIIRTEPEHRRDAVFDRLLAALHEA